MKTIILVMFLLIGNLSADLVQKGIQEYDNVNKEKAKKLYIKACDNGDRDGCYNLGLLYFNGDGVRQDKRKAKELFGKACDSGYNSGCKNYRILNEEGY